MYRFIITEPALNVLTDLLSKRKGAPFLRLRKSNIECTDEISSTDLVTKINQSVYIVISSKDLPALNGSILHYIDSSTEKGLKLINSKRS